MGVDHVRAISVDDSHQATTKAQPTDTCLPLGVAIERAAVRTEVGQRPAEVVGIEVFPAVEGGAGCPSPRARQLRVRARHSRKHTGEAHQRRYDGDLGALAGKRLGLV